MTFLFLKLLAHKFEKKDVNNLLELSVVKDFLLNRI